MPIHDWTRVSAGTWHAFHLSWTSEIQLALNDGLLPPDYYAQAEQIIGPLGPDVLTLQTAQPPANGHAGNGTATIPGTVAVATAPPRTRLTSVMDLADYTLKRRTIVVRHNSGDRIIALIELVSPGNKESRHALRTFVEKAAESLMRGYHLLIVDLFPPGPRDPDGIHGAICDEISNAGYTQPDDSPLTLVAYSADPPRTAYIEPTAVGRELIEMPLFLEPETYINVPLEATYREAYRGVPRRWKVVLDAPV